MKTARGMLWFLAAPMLWTSLAQAAPDKTWNLIAIVTDDQASWAVGSYGNDDIQTPNMDRLAREGARFTNFFVTSPICTPSRATTLTGLYSQQSGIQDVTSRRDRYEGLPLGVPTWPRVLKEHGYKTGLIGKWHLGRARRNYPTNYGIDYFFGFVGGATTPMDPVLERDHEKKRYPGATPDILTDDAITFLDRNRKGPFALMLHFRAPHAPHLPVPEEDLTAFDGLDPDVVVVDPAEAIMDDDQDPPAPASIALHKFLLKQKMISYYASVHSVDRNLGRVLDAIDEFGLSENTIVVFTSDNGYMYGHRGLKGKGVAQPIWNHTFQDNAGVVNMFDESIRVPMIIRWPRIVKPGKVVDELVSNLDIYASYLGMLGIRVPDNVSTLGLDFSPLLRDEPTDWRDIMFADLTTDQHPNLEFFRMARTKDWKLIRAYLNPAASQLYDLRNDPREFNNLYVTHKPSRAYLEDGELDPDDWRAMKYARDEMPIQGKLEEQLHEWLIEIDDPVVELEQIWNAAKRATFEKWERVDVEN